MGYLSRFGGTFLPSQSPRVWTVSRYTQKEEEDAEEQGAKKDGHKKGKSVGRVLNK